MLRQQVAQIGSTRSMPAGFDRLRRWVWLVARLAALVWLLSLARPPEVLVTLGLQQSVVTRNDLAGMHTRFIDEAETWKIQRGLAMIREMGAPWIVEFFPWAYLEPRKGQYQWQSAERIIDHANRQGLRVIARLGFVPEWARPNPNVQQTTSTYLDRSHYADFGEFAAAFAAHFKGRVDYIVIWNEPNLSGEWGMRPVDPAGYVELLRASYAPIKAANPDVMVLAGALAPTLEPAGSAQGLDDLLYLEQMYGALSDDGRRTTDDAQSSIVNRQSSIQNRPYDAWAIHSYGRTAPPEEAPAPGVINFRRTELLREVMVRHGDGDVPAFITEAGWNDDTRWAFGVTPAQRIQFTLGAWDYAQANWPWVRCVAMWVFKLPAPAHGYRDRYTFITPSLEPLPIYDEVKKALVP
jgi:polysaccharide biosynthesis protein PslG